MTVRSVARADDPNGLLIVRGHGLRLFVNRGRLTIEDGIADHRRTRELSRIERDVHRIVILGDTGTITLDAVRWLADVGIALIQVDRSGRALLTGIAPGADDARLRRAQAAAANSKVGLDVTRALIEAKIHAQASVAADLLDAPGIADHLATCAQQVSAAPDLVACRDTEARASNAYFSAWGHVRVRFAARDQQRVPDHWTYFTARSSPVNRGGRSPRNAASPVNAMINYAVSLAEIECRLAAITVGLDPGLGIVHTDRKDRDSLALDLLEPLRPLVERHVLQLVQARHFRADDFFEARDGWCRVLEPLTHEFVALMPEHAAAVGPIAERVAHSLARSSPGRIELRTPLTRANHMRAQTRGARSANRQAAAATDPMPSCRQCGGILWERGRQLCSACWAVTRTDLATQRGRRGLAVIATARAAGADPAQTEVARAKRQGSLLRMKADEQAWLAAGAPIAVGEVEMREIVIPGLARCTIKALQRATGLSASGCSMIRSGKRTPHPRHWDALAALVNVSGR